MTTLLLWAGVALEIAVLLGLVLRGNAGRVLTLPPLLVVLATSATLVGLCPTCSTWDFWIAKELLHELIVFALGVELAVRLFAPHPRTRWAACAWVALVAAGLAAVLATTPGVPHTVEILPRIAAALAWLYAGLTLLMLLASWGRGALVPDDLHRTLLVAFALYTMFYAITWSRTGDDTTVAGIANPLVFDLVMLLLLRAAWHRPPPAPYDGAP